MSSGRRWLGAATLLGLAGVTGGTGYWLETSATDGSDEDGKPVRAARARVEQAIDMLNRSRETRALTASRTGPLVSGLESGYDDPTTFQDAFETEAWWDTVRKESAFTALVVGNKTLAATGAERPEIGAGSSSLVARAREGKVASGVLRGQLNLYLASGALVQDAERAKAAGPVVVLGERADERLLSDIVTRTGDAVALSDGRRLLESAGPGERRRLLAGVAGKEKEAAAAASGAIEAARGWLATPVPLEAGGPWLWTVVAAPEAGRPPLLRAAMLGTTVALCAGAVLMLLLGRGRGARRGSMRGTPSSPSAAAHPATDMGRGPTLPAPDDEASHGHGRGHHGGHGVSREHAHAPDPGRRDAGAGSRAFPRPTSLPGAADPGGRGGSPGLAPAVAARAPSSMGRYTLLEQIGEGGMAEIHMAAVFGPEGFRRDFVVKRLHPHLARRKDVVSQFIDEARLQARLLHGNIVSVFDFGRAGDEYFLALEYVDGRDLDKIVHRHMQMFGRGLPLATTAYILHQVLDALAYAHNKADEQGRPLEIVHRDVSPGNVLVSYRGDVKLSDFGIVKAGQRVSRTEVGLVKGNASYMSPEQARGEVVDLRSDLFSTAVVMFYCLTGSALYRGETTLNQLMRAAVGPVTSQFDQIEELPVAVAPLLARALSLDPGTRFQTAAEFAADLSPLASTGKLELAALMDRLFPPESRRELA
jgi:hypothetical protein